MYTVLRIAVKWIAIAVLTVSPLSAKAKDSGKNPPCNHECTTIKCAPKCEHQCSAECAPKPKCEPKCEPKPCAPPCPQPKPPTQVCPGQDPCCPPWATPVLNAGYGYPARTLTRCSWAMYGDVSLLVWQPIQENMELGVSETNPNVATEGFHSHLIPMDFDYKPGFKIGIGGSFDHDYWDLNGEYTWFHATQNTNASASGGGAIFPTKNVFSTTGFESIYNRGVVYNSAAKKWTLNMDIAEVDLGRSYYVGTQLTFRPSIGLRTAFVTQYAKTTYVNNGTLALSSGGAITTSTADTNVVRQKSSSWALGPQVALDTNWLIAYGLSLYGSLEVDSLFTNYSKADVKVTNYNAAGAEVAGSGYVENQKNIPAVRTHLALELGLGWGTYFECNKWHMDLTAGYTFQSFFDQNMMRNYLATEVDTAPNGNLYLQGVTLKVKVDF